MAVAGCDLHGIARGKKMPASRLVENDESPLRVTNLMTVLDYGNYPWPPPAGDERWWPSWGEGYSDTRAVLVESSARVIPWLDKTGLVLCEFERCDGGGALDFLPRPLLRRVTERAQEMGFETRAALEFEFMLFRESPDEARARNFRNLSALWSTPQAYMLNTLDRHENILRPLREKLRDFGLDVETWNIEAAPGQVEMNLPPAEALTAADQGFLMKYAVKSITATLDQTASFMAMPEATGFGNGLHVNVSLSRHGSNAFYDPSGPAQCSALMRSFAAGVAAAIPELAVMYAPTINAYRRFTTHAFAGTMAAWGIDNRAVAVRAITESPARARIEHRSGGADANPYLVIAATLAAGLDGVQRGLASPPYVGDAYRDAEIPRFPATLAEATDRFESSTLAREWFGDDFVRFYSNSRRAEISASESAGISGDSVSDWELHRYFEIV